MAHRPIHRNSDRRDCGARTKTRCTNVRVNSRFISIQDDINTHTGGALKATITKGKVRANSVPIIVLNDPASPDRLFRQIGHEGHPHGNPKATSASPNVRAGNGS